MQAGADTGLSPPDPELAAAELALATLLAHYDEPQVLAAPPDLANRVVAALPQVAPLAPRSRWLRVGAALAVAAVIVLLALGGWGLLAPRFEDRLIAGQPAWRSLLLARMVGLTEPSALAPPALLPLPLLMSWIGLALLAMSSAIVVVWPRRTRGVALALRQAPLLALGLGLGATLLVSLALFVLSGLPLLSPLWWGPLLLVGLVLLLPYLVGLAAWGDLLSMTLRLPLAPPAATIVGLAIGLCGLGLLALGWPLLSLALGSLGAIGGLGAAVLSRAGSYASYP